MKRGTAEHPKLLDLCQRLKLAKWEAVGLLEMLWHFTAKFAPQGDIGRFTDEAVAAGVGWRRRSGHAGVTSGSYLVGALVASGWLDRCTCHRLVVHDWTDHADQTLRRFLASKKLAFIQHHASIPLAENSLPLPLPLPLPETNTQCAREGPDQHQPPPEDSDFAVWLTPWPRVASPDAAAQAWLSVVRTAEDVYGATAARDRYLASDEVSRGVIMDPARWLFEQARNAWGGRWPRAKAASGRAEQRVSKPTPAEDLEAKRWLAEHDEDPEVRARLTAELQRPV